MSDAVAWVVVGLLIFGAILVTDRLGFIGLTLLGALTLLIAAKAAMDQKIIIVIGAVLISSVLGMRLFALIRKL